MPEGDPQLPPLSVVMEKQDDIPEVYRGLYAEKDGKWALSGIAGVKTQTDIDRMQTSLTNERNDHKKTKERLTYFKDFNDEQLKSATEWLDKRGETEAKLEAAGKGPDEATVEKLVQARLNTVVVPLQREKTELTNKLEAANKVNAELQEEKRIRIIHDNVRGLRSELKFIDTAEDDILLLAERVLQVGEDGTTVTTKENVGITPNVSPKEWLIEMRPKKPHWFPETEGGGAPGSKGRTSFPNNPWTAEHWNITQQGKIIEADYKQAEAMARAAGVDVMAAHPRKKVA
jgi:hypothetical protein